MSKKITYSYRDPDRKGGVLTFTTDVNLKDKFPKTFGISESAMKGEDVEILTEEEKPKKVIEKAKPKEWNSIFFPNNQKSIDINYSPKNFENVKPMDEDIRVIVVGNSSSVLKYEYGNIIDSYDIVIRLNHCVTKGLEKHVGEKIDVWATTKLTYHLNLDGSLFYPSDVKNVKAIWRRTPNVKLDKVINLFDDRVSEFIMYKRSDRYNVASTIKGYKNCKWSRKLDTGLLTILTAIKLFKNVTVFGFDFYTDADYPTDYYRKFELRDDGTHPEDKWWERVKDTGFAGKRTGEEKLNLLDTLESKGHLKILNKEYKIDTHPIVTNAQDNLKDNMDGTPFIKKLHKKIKKSNFRDGLVTLYWENGNKRYEWYYKNGFQEGISMGFWPDGSKKSQRTYHLGELSGKSKTWYADGKLAGDRYYTKNIKDGLWRDYYPNGQLWVETLYNKGNTKEKKRWTEDGKKGSRKLSEKYKKKHNLQGTNHDEVFKDFFKDKNNGNEEINL